MKCQCVSNEKLALRHCLFCLALFMAPIRIAVNSPMSSTVFFMRDSGTSASSWFSHMPAGDEEERRPACMTAPTLCPIDVQTSNRSTCDVAKDNMSGFQAQGQRILFTRHLRNGLFTCIRTGNAPDFWRCRRQKCPFHKRLLQITAFCRGKVLNQFGALSSFATMRFPGCVAA